MAFVPPSAAVVSHKVLAALPRPEADRPPVACRQRSPSNPERPHAQRSSPRRQRQKLLTSRSPQSGRRRNRLAARQGGPRGPGRRQDRRSGLPPPAEGDVNLKIFTKKDPEAARLMRHSVAT